MYLGVAMNRGKHDVIRANPSRPRFLLRQAVAEAGLEVIGYEHEFASDSPRPVWYDVAVRLADGRVAVIFLHDYKSKQAANRYNVAARQRKIDYAREQEIPFVEVWPTSMRRIQAQIELWLMTMTRNPYREAATKPPKEDEGTFKRPTRTKRVW